MAASKTPKSQPRFTTIADAAAYLHVNTRTVRRMVADGTLTGYRHGSRILRVERAELDRVLRPIPSAASAGDGDGS